MIVHDFTPIDWVGYAGAEEFQSSALFEHETASPLIGDAVFNSSDGEQLTITFIGDANGIQAFAIDEDGEVVAVYNNRISRKKYVIRTFLHYLPDEVSSSFMQAIGFEKEEM